MHRSLALLSAVTLAAVALAHDDDPKILHRLPPWSGPGHVPGSVLNNLQATTPGTPGGTMFGLG
ncbi:MAG: hypothetical protein QF404_04370, partial [Planctomycetota bacterium]|nr:hypothetical protein [Planctomycetota bacterium]